MMSYTLRPRRAAGIWVGLCFWFSAASWSQTPPEFDAQFLFPGFPSALNERGDAVGWATVGGVSRGWVAVQAAGGVDARLLPLPAGVAESYANDISADGIVVGQAGADAAVWLPPYDAAPIMLGRLPDTVQCEATAVNQPLDSNGHTRDVVGYCAFAGFMSGPAVLWSQVNGSPAFAGLVPLNLTSAAGMVGVEDVNDARQVVGESSVFDLDDLSTSPTKTDLDGNLPPEFVRSLLFAINEPGAGGPFGQVAGFARLGTSQQADQEIVRNDNGTWEVLSGAGVYNNAYGIAPNGDLSIEYTTVCGAGSAAVIAAGVYLDGLDRLFCLDDLLAAGSRDWLLDAPIFDNDIVLDPGTGRRRVLVAATNPASGQSGTVLLTETGALSVPAPVADFACRPSSDPLGIFCDWTPTDDLANRYVMERKESGNQQQAFSEVCQTTVPQCFDLTTAPGMTYEYRVQAVGLAGASDWQYTTATAPDTPPPPAGGSGVIGDLVWEDANGDGVRDSGEPGLAGVMVELWQCDGGRLASTSTDAGGKYRFDGLAAGRYQVHFFAPAGYTFSPQRQGSKRGKDSDPDANGTTACIKLTDGQQKLGIDAGLVADGGAGGTGQIGDFVWQDNNGNGIQDRGEPGIAGVTVHLEQCGGAALASTVTDGGGRYLFTELAAGRYVVRFIAPTGYVFSPTRDRGKQGKDSDPDATGVTGCISLSDGAVKLGIDAGLVPR